MAAPNAKAGYQFVPEAINPKTGKRYTDPRSIVREISTGKLIPRRQYIKQTEGIPSLESKARRLARSRLIKGIRDPQKRYKAAVSAWRKTRGPGAHVRGKTAEALEFQELNKRLNALYAQKKSKWGKKEIKEYTDIQRRFGLLTQTEFDAMRTDSPKIQQRRYR